MYVYTYQAALLCEPCGETMRKNLTDLGEAPADPDDETSYDSDDFPKGPEQEGESDYPSHCDFCHRFLESDLTEEGQKYVKEACEEALCSGDWERVCLTEWMPFYDPELSPKAIRLGRMTAAVRELADKETGELPAYAWPGGYPIFYVACDSDVCCVKCTNDHETGLGAFGIEGRDLITAHDVNWEDPDLYCDCGERIESAYAEPDDDDDERYSVLVGNIGNVLQTHSLDEARSTFAEYVAQSKQGIGRAAGESVTLFDRDDILDEHPEGATSP